MYTQICQFTAVRYWRFVWCLVLMLVCKGSPQRWRLDKDVVWLSHEDVILRDPWHEILDPLQEGIWPVQHNVALQSAYQPSAQRRDEVVTCLTCIDMHSPH